MSCEVWSTSDPSDLLNWEERLSNARNANEVAELLPEGVYTTIRTYGKTRAVLVEHHFERLEESALLLGGCLAFDHERLRRKMRIAILKSRFSEIRLRIQMTISEERPRIYLILENLTVPDDKEYAGGASVLTRKMHRDTARAKSSRFLHVAKSIRDSLAEGVNEVVMVGDDGLFLEGLSSNFFAVSSGSIWTADQGILPGFTREIVLRVVSQAGIPLILHGYAFDQYPTLDEAFITSASRGVLPITQIDGFAIGSGTPGRITQQVRQLYEEQIESLLEEL